MGWNPTPRPAQGATPRPTGDPAGLVRRSSEGAKADRRLVFRSPRLGAVRAYYYMPETGAKRRRGRVWNPEEQGIRPSL
jgi:hypothetical protein